MLKFLMLFCWAILLIFSPIYAGTETYNNAGDLVAGYQEEDAQLPQDKSKTRFYEDVIAKTDIFIPEEQLNEIRKITDGSKIFPYEIHSIDWGDHGNMGDSFSGYYYNYLEWRYLIRALKNDDLSAPNVLKTIQMISSDGYYEEVSKKCKDNRYNKVCELVVYRRGANSPVFYLPDMYIVARNLKIQLDLSSQLEKSVIPEAHFMSSEVEMITRLDLNLTCHASTLRDASDTIHGNSLYQTTIDFNSVQDRVFEFDLGEFALRSIETLYVKNAFPDSLSVTITCLFDIGRYYADGKYIKKQIEVRRNLTFSSFSAESDTVDLLSTLEQTQTDEFFQFNPIRLSLEPFFSLPIVKGYRVQGSIPEGYIYYHNSELDKWSFEMFKRQIKQLW